jgi:hypothetical protein
VAVVKGGGKLAAKLRELAEKVKNPGTLEVGFLEGSTYPDGTSLPLVAATQEFGGTIEVAEHGTTIYRKLNAAGTEFLRDGKFVKRDAANFASDHTVPAHTITIPARPYFRSMVAEKSSGWGKSIGATLVENDYDATRTLELTGDAIKAQLQQSIINFDGVPLKPATVAAKGFDTQLIDSGHMVNSVDSQVKS